MLGMDGNADSVSNFSKGRTTLSGTPSSSSVLPSGKVYITSTFLASSSTNSIIARRATSGRTTRTTLPQEIVSDFLELPTFTSSGDGAVSAFNGGKSSPPVSRSPPLSFWMSSWICSQTSARHGSSGSEPSSAAALYSKEKRLGVSEVSPASFRLNSSRRRPWLMFNSKFPPWPSSTRPQDSAEMPLPNRTCLTRSPRKSSIRFRNGSISALISS
mmetsp:Transcript_84810/g.163431  ORF Transcript_84810/g.163431 Transcript_84810/m.163431 type:complete len:215 (-) Transcript_84810:152-796(-)